VKEVEQEHKNKLNKSKGALECFSWGRRTRLRTGGIPRLVGAPDGTRASDNMYKVGGCDFRAWPHARTCACGAVGGASSNKNSRRGSSSSVVGDVVVFCGASAAGKWVASSAEAVDAEVTASSAGAVDAEVVVGAMVGLNTSGKRFAVLRR
jgi:hypothetical protein